MQFGNRRCIKLGLASINGLDFIMYHQGPLNGWYTPTNRKIYISDVMNAMDIDELRAIYYHEEGYKK
jgi:Zn-dependent protease with chaperone function